MTQDALTAEELKALEDDINDGKKPEGADDLTGGIHGLSISGMSQENKENKENKDDNEQVEELDPQQEQRNIQLLLDVFVQVTVELGRAQHDIKYILGLGEGSIIELDKPASEPVELLVNNQLVAKGEVVVIDENFGVRITKIIDPKERLMRITG